MEIIKSGKYVILTSRLGVKEFEKVLEATLDLVNEKEKKEKKKKR